MIFIFRMEISIKRLLNSMHVYDTWMDCDIDVYIVTDHPINVYKVF